MNVGQAQALGTTASETSTLRAARWSVPPSVCAAALGLGLADHTLVALTHLGAAWPFVSVMRVLALAATIAAVVVADRRGLRAGAWALLAVAYALLASMILRVGDNAHYLVGDAIMSHAVAFALFVGDRRVAAGRGRRLTYVAAGVAGVTLGALILALVLHVGPDLFADDDAWTDERTLPHFVDLYVAYVALHWLLFGGAAVLLYGERRLAEAAVRRLHAAELERLARSRQITQSRLQLMQARIEPDFLFSTLERVKRLYAREPEWAECMLDELGAFLRAAMPQMRESYSTVGREAELVRAYLAIMRIHLRNRLECDIDVPPELAQVPLPSMMLLPLVDRHVAPALASPTGHVHLRICASREGSRLRIAITSTAGSPIRDEQAAIAAIEERLGLLYRGRASLSCSVERAGGSGIVLEIPLEPTEERADSRL